MGVTLQSDNAKVILEPDYRPWPKLHAGDAVSDAFYRRLDRNKPAHIDELRAFTTRADRLRYEQELKTQIGLFGKAVVTSLERTMGHYLKVGSCNRAFSLPNTIP